MKIAYMKKKFTDETLQTIKDANKIIGEYKAQGIELTLRQLYYQFVARGLLENSQKKYAKLGDAISNGRLGGLISWMAIVDRTRNLEKNSHWDGPRDFLDSVTPQFGMNKWADQENYVEIWVEKDALVGIVETVAREHDVSYFSCRGYTSQSEMWMAGMRFKRADEAGKSCKVIHLGDHDPSGKDMTRDVRDRLELFSGAEIEVNRIALNMDQVRKYNPPPNPAKITDPRAKEYIREFGQKSWELDALEPRALSILIRKAVESYRDDDLYNAAVELEEGHRADLVKAAGKFEDE